MEFVLGLVDCKRSKSEWQNLIFVIYFMEVFVRRGAYGAHAGDSIETNGMNFSLILSIVSI